MMEFPVWYGARQAMRLYKLCHPDWPVPTADWFLSRGLLLERHALHAIGYALFSIAPGLDRGEPRELCYGVDLGVHPKWRSKGVGLFLHQERLRCAREAGALAFIGATQPDNHAMRRIFEQCGAKAGDLVEKCFVDGSPGLIYTGPTEV